MNAKEGGRGSHVAHPVLTGFSLEEVRGESWFDVFLPPEQRSRIHDVFGRVLSERPPPGVHPRVIMSPEDLPGWRESVRETYRGREFLASRNVSLISAGLDEVPMAYKDIEAVMAAIESTGAIAYTSRSAQAEAGLAIEALAPLPESPYKAALVSLAEFSVNRSY